jgi:hypothetical protein
MNKSDFKLRYFACHNIFVKKSFASDLLISFYSTCFTTDYMTRDLWRTEGHEAHMWKMKNPHKIWLEKLKRRDHLADPGAHWMVTLKQILKNRM